jgi:hypothetical protein
VEPVNFGAVHTLLLLYLSEHRRPLPLRLHDPLLRARLPGLQSMVRSIQRLPRSFTPGLQRRRRERLPPAISIQGHHTCRQAAFEVWPPRQQCNMIHRGMCSLTSQPL